MSYLLTRRSVTVKSHFLDLRVRILKRGWLIGSVKMYAQPRLSANDGLVALLSRTEVRKDI